MVCYHNFLLLKKHQWVRGMPQMVYYHNFLLLLKKH